jgi:hypothetical protein
MSRWHSLTSAGVLNRSRNSLASLTCTPPKLREGKLEPRTFSNRTFKALTCLAVHAGLDHLHHRLASFPGELDALL